MLLVQWASLAGEHDDFCFGFARRNLAHVDVCRGPRQAIGEIDREASQAMKGHVRRDLGIQLGEE